MFGCYHCHAQMDDLQDLVAHCKNQQSDVSGTYTNRPRARYDPRAPPPPIFERTYIF